MFDVSAWLTEALISGVSNGVFAREYAAVKAADYMLKGTISAEQVAVIAAATAPTPEAADPEVPAEDAP